jgi:hypothetical protein
MSKIPDDIMRLAIDISLNPKTPAVMINSFPGACAIAEAVLRERDRCASICDTWAKNCGSSREIPASIAAEIREGSK